MYIIILDNVLNIGDTWGKAAFTVNSKHLERALIAYYARLWGIKDPPEGNKLPYWGYVTSMGATEGIVPPAAQNVCFFLLVSLFTLLSIRSSSPII
jgi:hypothetical protein